MQEELYKRINQVMLNESEQLDELKKETLGNYIKKAALRSGQLKSDAGQNNQISLDAFRAHDNKKWEKHNRFANELYHKANKHLDGIETATKKLVKGQYQESILDKLSVALEYLDEEQLDQLAEMIADMLED